MELLCQRCGEQFTAKRNHARFCSGCYTKRRQEQTRQSAENQRGQCLGCGTQTSRGGKYCRSCFRILRPFKEKPCRTCGKAFERTHPNNIVCPSCRQKRLQEHEKARAIRTQEPCANCGKPRTRGSILCYVCSNQEKARRLHENSTGRVVKDGYVYIRVLYGSPGKGKGGFYRGEHILVWERINGKPLPKGFVVHHYNGVKDDNRPQNLLGLPRQEHHSHPREVLRLYERRILELERELNAVQQLKLLE